MFNHILIPTDGSPISNKAAKAGVALASRLKARVTVYFAIEELQMIYAEGYAMDQITIDRIEDSDVMPGKISSGRTPERPRKAKKNL